MRSENVHKLSPAATKNADCYRTMTKPVNNMIMRSDYNLKQQSNTPPNLGGSAISEVKEGEALGKRIVQNRTPISNSPPHA